MVRATGDLRSSFGFQTSPADETQRRSIEAKARMEARRAERTTAARRPVEVAQTVAEHTAPVARPEAETSIDIIPALPESIRSESSGYSDDMGAVEANLRIDGNAKQCRKLLLEVLSHSQEFKPYQIKHALYKLIESLNRSSSPVEINLAKAIASQWKAISDGIQEGNSITLNNLTSADLEALGLTGESVTTLTLTGIPKADKEKEAYIYELISYIPIKSILDNPSSTTAQIRK